MDSEDIWNIKLTEIDDCLNIQMIRRIKGGRLYLGSFGVLWYHSLSLGTPRGGTGLGGDNKFIWDRLSGRYLWRV